MDARRHLFSLLTLVALLIGPFAITPRAAEAATVTYLVDKLTDTTTAGTTCQDLVPDDCSLRDAIAKANAAPNADTKVISFELFTGGTLGGAAPFIIALSSLLPEIVADNVQIEASLTLDGLPQVEIDGNGRAVGLQLAGDNGLVKGLSFYGFTNSGIEPFLGSAIYITGSGNRVETSFIGVNWQGQVPTNKANFSGIRIDGAGATGNIIGGPGGSAVANYVSGNQQNGVIIRNASGNFIQNNIIGLARVGSTLELRGNGQYGVQITSLSGTSANNVIGGSTTTLANIIGGNGQAGVLIRGSGTTSTTIQSNYIGLDKNTETGFPNVGEAGVVVEAGAQNTLLGGVAAAPLVISGNNGYGVMIRQGEDGTIPVNTRISGTTYIGTTRGGNAARANVDGGVLIAGAIDTTIDGTSGSVRISGNTGPGVTVEKSIDGVPSTNTQIIGTLIGVTPSGGLTNLTPNTQGGVLVDGVEGTLIGGNTISGNNLFGLRLNEARNSVVQGNFFGLNIARDNTRPNSGPGIAVANSENTLIGGAIADRNYIAGNNGPGVVITGTATLSTTIDANLFGLARDSVSNLYTVAAANTGEGVLVEDGPRQTVIGGAVGNTFGGAATGPSDPAAIRLTSSLSPRPTSFLTTTAPLAVVDAVISGNTIGYLPNGSQPPLERPFGAGVAIDGLAVANVQVNSNSMRFNAGDAVRVTGGITVTIAENQDLSNNDGRGVFVAEGAEDVQIISNTIRANAQEAVRVEDVSTRHVTIRSNRMAANGGAVVLDSATTYGGTPPDTIAGPNHDIDPPFDIRVTQGGLILGKVYTSTLLAENALSPASACVTCTIQVFSPDPTLPAPDGQGWDLVALEGGSVIVPDATGSFTAQLQGPLPNQLLFAATDGYGNTSEFAVFTPSASLDIVPVDPASAAQDAAPGQTVTYTLRLENSGTLDLTNVQLATGGTLAGWTVNVSPAGQISVPPQGSTLVTYTLTLPTGSHPSVQVPIADTTTVTASAALSPAVNPAGSVSDSQQLVTTVLERAVLRVQPVTGSGVARPEDRVTYSHRLINDGNITVTVELEAFTLDPAQSSGIWETALSIETLTLAPGEFRDVALNITVPAAAQEGVVATHYITATASVNGVPMPDLTRYFSDTTRVALQQRADMFSDETQDGEAGGTVTFFHTVRNLSNGPATFQLDYQANLKSTVQFFSDTPGITIGANNTFTISNIQEPGNTMRLRVVVTLNESLLRGDQEVINIFLRDPLTGESIGGAAVVDRVNITSGNVLPRLWLPMIFSE